MTRKRIYMFLALVIVSVIMLAKGKRVLFLGDSITDGARVVPFNSLVGSTIAAHPTVPAAYWIWDGILPTPAMHSLMTEEWLKDSGL